MSFEPRCLPTMIGSLPHLNEAEACRLVLRYTPEIPAWPQLSRRSPLENMYVQFSEHLPGVRLDDGKISVDYGPRFDAALEQLYADYLSGDVARYLPGAQRAIGLKTLLELKPENGASGIVAAKGQLTGPISLGLQVTDTQLRPILYDEIASDALGRYLRLTAAAQERALAKLSSQTIIFLDEPYLHALGSALFSLSRETVTRQLEEVFGGITGLKGMHCCGNTDWSIVLETSLDVLSFDAFNYGETLALYPREVKAFVDRGGIIAWGIVPNRSDGTELLSVQSLTNRLIGEMKRLVDKGISLDRLVAQSMITPSCGLSGLSDEGAEYTLALLSEVSKAMRDKFYGRNS